MSKKRSSTVSLAFQTAACKDKSFNYFLGLLGNCISEKRSSTVYLAFWCCGSSTKSV